MRLLQSLLLSVAAVFGATVSSADANAQNTTVCTATAGAGDVGKTEVEFHIDPGEISSVTKVEIWKPMRGHPQGGVWDPVETTTTIDEDEPDKVTVELVKKAAVGDKYRVTLSTSTTVRSYNTTFK